MQDYPDQTPICKKINKNPAVSSKNDEYPRVTFLNKTSKRKLSPKALPKASTVCGINFLAYAFRIVLAMYSLWENWEKSLK